MKIPTTFGIRRCKLFWSAMYHDVFFNLLPYAWHTICTIHAVQLIEQIVIFSLITDWIGIFFPIQHSRRSIAGNWKVSAVHAYGSADDGWLGYVCVGVVVFEEQSTHRNDQTVARVKVRTSVPWRGGGIWEIQYDRG